jgi:tetratricopeptide (TPR) repeat protein
MNAQFGVLLTMAGALASVPQSGESTRELLSIQDALQAGKLDAAERMIDGALEEHPKDGGLFNLRGVVHAERRELAAAREDFAQAVRLSPTLTPAWQNLARACQIEADQAPCAMAAWQHVLRAKPEDLEARKSLALLYLQGGKYVDSLREVEKLPGSGGNAELLVRCADLCGLGRYAEAKGIAARLVHSSDFSESDLEMVANAFSSASAAPVIVALIESLDRRGAASLASLRRLAIAYERIQQPSNARKTLERVATLDPRNTAHLFELARLAEMSKDHEGALGFLAHARDLAPDDAQIYFLWGVIAAEMDLPVEARGSLEKALELSPGNPSYSYAMGTVILSTRDAATAARYFEKFVTAKPEEPRGHYALGIAYFASGDYEHAKREMQGVATDSRTASGAEYFLGRMARLDGDLDDAVRHLQKSIELLPTFAESHTELGRVRMLQADLNRARAEIGRALKLDPRSFQANDQLLVLYKRTHDPRAAQQEELLKKLDEERSRRAELMLRTIEAKPY